jgi:hypothetical protein
VTRVDLLVGARQVHEAPIPAPACDEIARHTRGDAGRCGGILLGFPPRHHRKRTHAEGKSRPTFASNKTGIVLKGEQGRQTTVLATWIIRSKKDGLGLLDHAYPLTRNPMDGQGEPVLLAGWREKDSIRQAHRRRSGSTCSRKPSGCRASSLRSEDSGNTMTRWRTSTHS